MLLGITLLLYHSCSCVVNFVGSYLPHCFIVMPSRGRPTSKVGNPPPKQNPPLNLIEEHDFPIHL